MRRLPERGGLETGSPVFRFFRAADADTDPPPAAFAEAAEVSRPPAPNTGGAGIRAREARRSFPFRLPQYWGLGGLLLCAGCAPHPAAPAPPAAQAAWTLTFAASPPAPKSYDPAALTVRVRDAAGRPVRGAAVTLALSMPAMEMGRNEVTARETSPGVYTGTGRFTMSGDWQVAAAAAGASGRRTQMFSLKVQ